MAVGIGESVVFGVATYDDVARNVRIDRLGLIEREVRAVRFIEFVSPGDNFVPVDRRLELFAVLHHRPIVPQLKIAPPGRSVIGYGWVIVRDGEVPDSITVTVFQIVLVVDVHVSSGGNSQDGFPIDALIWICHCSFLFTMKAESVLCLVSWVLGFALGI